MREAKTFRPYAIFAAAAVFLALLTAFLAPPLITAAAQPAASAAPILNDQNSAPNIPADGFYYVNDDFKFTLARKYGVTLMRFAGDDEVFVLNVERGSVGGRVLKYDTGDVALQVTGYGGVTLYTTTAPGGLPAERTGDGEPITFPVPTISMIRAQAERFAELLYQVHDLNLTFEADYDRLDDSGARYLVLDAMRITWHALKGLCANRADQARLEARLHSVRVVRGDRPAATLRNGTLTVAIAPVYGLRGRLSSLATARAIRTQL